jgi:glutathione S-transferase
MDLTFYYAPITCALVPLITLNEVRAEFQTVSLNLARGEHKEHAFTRINPKQKVPALVVDGVTVSENVAIHMWLDQTFPKASLLPRDAMEKLQAISLMSWFAAGIHPTITPIAFPHWFCDVPGSEEGTKRVSQAKLSVALKYANDLLDGKDWFFEKFSAVDAYFFWCWRRANQACSELGHFTNCANHGDRMLKRESVISALRFEAHVIRESVANA